MSYKSASHSSMDDNTLMQEKASGYCLRSLQTGEEFLLDHEMLVGREVECQISLNSGHISRYHAKLTLVEDAVVVEDLRSTNGTFINGRRIHAPQALALGDEIRFHEQAFRLVSNQAHSGDADATLFQPIDSTARSALMAAAAAVPAPAPVPIPVKPAPVEEPLPELEDSSTRILSVDELQRLQGKGERVAKGPENGSGPRFVVLTAPIRGKVFSLRSQQRNAWVIGRDERCQFNLFDKTVSGEHARVRKLADDWILESCEGRNPIYINNRPVEISTLQHGDVVRMGRMEMMFRTDESVSLSRETPEPEGFEASRVNIVLVCCALALLGLVIGIMLV